MDKADYFIEVFFISSIIGIISKFLGTINTSYIILLILLIFDTITGASVAIKYRRFNSKGFSRFIKKVLTYTISIITMRLLEIGILPLFETVLFSQTIVAFLQITEAISILENLTLLGVPLPAKLIQILLKHLNIPGLDKALKLKRKHEDDIRQIEEIINHHVKNIKDENIKKMVGIKFETWKNIAYEINIIYSNQERSNEVIYYKTLFFIESGFKEMKEKWKEENIPQAYIDLCEQNCRPNMERWLQKVYDICYSDLSIEQKKEQLIDSIIVMLYQTLFIIQKYQQ